MGHTAPRGVGYEVLREVTSQYMTIAQDGMIQGVTYVHIVPYRCNTLWVHITYIVHLRLHTMRCNT